MPMVIQPNNKYRRRVGILLRRIIHIIRYPIAHVIHWWKFDVLAKPGYAGFAGGIFNPGAIVQKDGAMLMVAKGQNMHWLDALKFDSGQLLAGAPILFEFKAPMAEKSVSKILGLREFPADGFKAEDFRLCVHKGQILVNHSMIRSDGHETLARPALSRLCQSGGELRFLGYPQLDVDLALREKNWVYLEADDRLLLFYSFSPFRVLELIDEENLRFATTVNLELKSRFTELGGFGSLISFSVNPIIYDDRHYLLVVHQIEHKAGDRQYYHWGVLLDRTTLTPEQITNRPLFNATGARGRCKRVLYVMAVVKSENEFIFLCGEGDSYVTRTRISHTALDKLFMG